MTKTELHEYRLKLSENSRHIHRMDFTLDGSYKTRCAEVYPPERRFLTTTEIEAGAERWKPAQVNWSAWGAQDVETTKRFAEQMLAAASYADQLNKIYLIGEYEPEDN